MSTGSLNSEFINPNDTTSSTSTFYMECPIMMAFPNPSDDEINIEVDNILDDSDIDTSLYNSKGEKKKDKKTKDKKHNLDVSDLPTGTYYLKVKVKSKDDRDVILEETVVIL